jgi:hypothetical protein
VAKSCGHGNEVSGSVIVGKNSSVAERMASSQEGLSSMELDSSLVTILTELSRLKAS